ncbi:hypothetical protein [Aquimarina sp. I32.4]|uniref:hypothetical protein n=1 Tax=Aquimarina sp. I32.4 TaxID=2053903 RepID=UPI000CDEDE35|nr:hypothetical protein [Aquimarina sp. I32.4]
MTIKKTIIIASFALAILGACAEKKEDKTDSTKSETTQETASDIKKTTEIDEAEKRRLDSIQQVKEHGHAH